MIKVQYRIEQGKYADTSLQFSKWTTGTKMQIDLASIKTEGSYRVVIVISQKETGTTVLAVPYYFIIE